MVIVKGKSDEWRDLLGWADYYFHETGIHLNINTLKKRREVSGLGVAVPPRTILLTLEEFKVVIATPLPGCTSVPGRAIRSVKAHRPSSSGKGRK